MILLNKILAKTDLAVVRRSRITRSERELKELLLASGAKNSITHAFARRFGMPAYQSRIALVISSFEQEAVPDFLARYPQCRLEFVVFSDASENSPKFLKIPDPYSDFRSVPAGSPQALKKHPDLEIVLYAAAFPSEAMDKAICDLEALGLGCPYVADLPTAARDSIVCVPYHYATWEKQLKGLSSRLADLPSRLVLAARIRAMCTGNAEYLVVSPYWKGQHPLVSMESNGFSLGLEDSGAETANIHAILREKEEALRAGKPNMAVAVHHEPTDVLRVAEFIDRLDPGYTLFLGHHSLTGNGTVLYAALRPGKTAERA